MNGAIAIDPFCGNWTFEGLVHASAVHINDPGRGIRITVADVDMAVASKVECDCDSEAAGVGLLRDIDPGREGDRLSGKPDTGPVKRGAHAPLFGEGARNELRHEKTACED